MFLAAPTECMDEAASFGGNNIYQKQLIKITIKFHIYALVSLLWYHNQKLKTQQ